MDRVPAAGRSTRLLQHGQVPLAQGQLPARVDASPTGQPDSASSNPKKIDRSSAVDTAADLIKNSFIHIHDASSCLDREMKEILKNIILYCFLIISNVILR